MAQLVQEFTKKDARRLLMCGQGLLNSPTRKANANEVADLVHGLGFVQVDSINVVDRAHNLTLGTRMDGYREQFLTRLVEADRRLFEDWTHDASLIPMEYYGYWHWRRRRYAERIEQSWSKKGISKSERLKIYDSILDRIQEEGALSTSDFKVPGHNSTGWWNWSPMKAGLEYLWRTGQLAISYRLKFQKYYDLPERVIPKERLAARPSREETLAWSISEALMRLGSATSRELSHYWNMFTAPEVERWCVDNLADQVELDGRRYWLRPDWENVLKKLTPAPKRLRLLCPFDPLIRDRQRLKFLFDFVYRFEAFVPEAKRVYGYYVFPILSGESLVGRINLKFDRKLGRLLVLGLWWESGQRPKMGPLKNELKRLAKRIGASSISLD